MSEIDLSNKAIYDMVNDQKVKEKNTSEDSSVDSSVFEEEKTTQPRVVVSTPSATSAPAKAPEHKFKMERSFKNFIIFVLVIVFIAAFIYFTIYRLGWGIKECINHNYQDCAALLTPEIAPLAATGLLALL